MALKKLIQSKLLSNGSRVEIFLVQDDIGFFAALYVDQQFIFGPRVPQRLNETRGTVTHWLGNHPSVGLTADEAEKILWEVKVANDVLEHRKNLA